MKRINKIALILLSLAPFLAVAGFTLAQKPLEVDYPVIGGGSPTIDIPLPDYIRYVYIFLISSVGAIGLIILIIAGVRYLSSAGSPEKMKNSRQQVLSAFWGIILLLSAYLIFITINPKILSPEIIPLPALPPPESLPAIPLHSTPTPDLLGRIKQLVETINQIPGMIQKSATDIQTKIGRCNCQNTQSLCVCVNRTSDAPSACQPRFCYAGEDPAHSGLCPDSILIYSLQKTISDQRDMILYYKNRVLAEKQDLERDVAGFIDPKITWLNGQIAANQKVMSQLQGADRQAKETIIKYLEEELQRRTEEKNYKTDLIQKLQELANAIERERTPTTQIVQLVDNCFYNVKTQCQASCQGKCHDYLQGCQAGACSGGNPCPVAEIQQTAQAIGAIPGSIDAIISQIINIINSIKK